MGVQPNSVYLRVKNWPRIIPRTFLGLVNGKDTQSQTEFLKCSLVFFHWQTKSVFKTLKSVL